MSAEARWNPAIALSYVAHENLCVNNIARNGSDDIRKRYLPRLCSGDAIGALGYEVATYGTGRWNGDWRSAGTISPGWKA